jgi:hypothetical protein
LSLENVSLVSEDADTSIESKYAGLVKIPLIRLPPAAYETSERYWSLQEKNAWLDRALLPTERRKLRYELIKPCFAEILHPKSDFQRVAASPPFSQGFDP